MAWSLQKQLLSNLQGGLSPSRFCNDCWASVGAQIRAQSNLGGLCSEKTQSLSMSSVGQSIVYRFSPTRNSRPAAAVSAGPCAALTPAPWQCLVQSPPAASAGKVGCVSHPPNPAAISCTACTCVESTVLPSWTRVSRDIQKQASAGAPSECRVQGCIEDTHAFKKPCMVTAEQSPLHPLLLNCNAPAPV